MRAQALGTGVLLLLCLIILFHHHRRRRRRCCRRRPLLEVRSRASCLPSWSKVGENRFLFCKILEGASNAGWAFDTPSNTHPEPWHPGMGDADFEDSGQQIAATSSEQTHVFANFQEHLAVDFVVTLATILNNLVQFLVVALFSNLFRNLSQALFPAAHREMLASFSTVSLL